MTTLEDLAREIREALYNPGINPSYHDKQRTKLMHSWPTLWLLVTRVAHEAGNLPTDHGKPIDNRCFNKAPLIGTEVQVLCQRPVGHDGPHVNDEQTWKYEPSMVAADTRSYQDFLEFPLAARIEAQLKQMHVDPLSQLGQMFGQGARMGALWMARTILADRFSYPVGARSRIASVAAGFGIPQFIIDGPRPAGVTLCGNMGPAAYRHMCRLEEGHQGLHEHDGVYWR